MQRRPDIKKAARQLRRIFPRWSSLAQARRGRRLCHGLSDRARLRPVLGRSEGEALPDRRYEPTLSDGLQLSRALCRAGKPSRLLPRAFLRGDRFVDGAPLTD